MGNLKTGGFFRAAAVLKGSFIISSIDERKSSANANRKMKILWFDIYILRIYAIIYSKILSMEGDT